MAELRVCIVRLSALGDVCLAVPLVRAIQDQHPNAHITWIIGKPAHALLEELSGVRFVVLDKQSHWRGYLKVRNQLRQLEFDVLLGLQASFRAHLLYPFIHAKRKIGYDRPRQRDLHSLFIRETIPPLHGHLLDGFLLFGKAIGINPTRLHWDLPISTDDWSWAENALKKRDRWLAINPVASKRERTWALPRYAQVAIEAARRWNCGIALTGGPDPSEMRQALNLETQIRQGGLEPLNLCGKTTPKQLAAVLGSVQCLLAPDTGPAHIADAMGTPVVGLYAVIGSNLSGPYRSLHRVVDRYREAVHTILGKNPDEIRWGTRVHNSRAMDLISCEDVLVQLSKLFDVP